MRAESECQQESRCATSKAGIHRLGDTTDAERAQIQAKLYSEEKVCQVLHSQPTDPGPSLPYSQPSLPRSCQRSQVPRP